MERQVYICSTDPSLRACTELVLAELTGTFVSPGYLGTIFLNNKYSLPPGVFLRGYSCNYQQSCL